MSNDRFRGKREIEIEVFMACSVVLGLTSGERRLFVSKAR